MLVTLGVSIGALIGLYTIEGAGFASSSASFACPAPEILDGDTLDCGAGRIRLTGIDAPELPGHCRPGRSCVAGDSYASTDNLYALASGVTLQCRQTDTDVYGRTVARCEAEGIDLSCAQLKGGFAVRRYGWIFC